MTEETDENRLDWMVAEEVDGYICLSDRRSNMEKGIQQPIGWERLNDREIL